MNVEEALVTIEPFEPVDVAVECDNVEVFVLSPDAFADTVQELVEEPRCLPGHDVAAQVAFADRVVAFKRNRLDFEEPLI